MQKIKYGLTLSLGVHLFCSASDLTRPISEAPDGRVNYPSNFQVDHGLDLFVFGEYLYWLAEEDGLYYAQTGKGSGTAQFPVSGDSDFRGSLKRIRPDWESAFRIGLGLNFPKEGYDLAFTWTNYSTDAHNSVDAGEHLLFSTWAIPDAPETASATFAKASWKLDLNSVDFEWGRSSWFGGNFSLRPFFGIRWLLIDQIFHNHTLFATSPSVLGKLRSESTFQGGGIRAGGDMRFALPFGFSVYGIAGGALLYGKIDSGFSVKEDGVKIAQTKDDEWKGIANLQLSLGFSWDTHLFKERCHLEFHAGWEQNGYFNVNQMNHYLGDLSQGNYFKENGNLTLQGIVAGGRFDF